MNKTLPSFLLLGLCWMFGYQSNAFAKPKTVSSPVEPTMDWAWTKAPWTADDKPFADLRLEINQQAQQGKLTDAQVNEWKVAYQKTPFDAKNLFRWAFSAYRREEDSPTRNKERLRGVLNGFQTVETFTSVSAYNFVRLKFMVMASDLPFHELLPLGKRLLAKEPKDYFVKLHVANMLYYDVPAEWALKQRYIDELRKQNPRGWKPKQVLAEVYYRKWFFSQWDKKSTGKQQAERSISEIQKLAAEPPVNPFFQQLAADYIKRIKEIQAKREFRSNRTRFEKK